MTRIFYEIHSCAPAPLPADSAAPLRPPSGSFAQAKDPLRWLDLKFNVVTFFALIKKTLSFSNCGILVIPSLLYLPLTRRGGRAPLSSSRKFPTVLNATKVLDSKGPSLFLFQSDFRPACGCDGWAPDHSRKGPCGNSVGIHDMNNNQPLSHGKLSPGGVEVIRGSCQTEVVPREDVNGPCLLEVVRRSYFFFFFLIVSLVSYIYPKTNKWKWIKFHQVEYNPNLNQGGDYGAPPPYFLLSWSPFCPSMAFRSQHCSQSCSQPPKEGKIKFNILRIWNFIRNIQLPEGKNSLWIFCAQKLWIVCSLSDRALRRGPSLHPRRLPHVGPLYRVRQRHDAAGRSVGEPNQNKKKVHKKSRCLPDKREMNIIIGVFWEKCRIEMHTKDFCLNPMF